MKRPQRRLVARVIRNLLLQIAINDLSDYQDRAIKKLLRHRKRTIIDAEALLSRLDPSVSYARWG